MRILHVNKTFYPDTRGGVEEVVCQINGNTSGSIEAEVFTLSEHAGKAAVIKQRGMSVYRAKSNVEIASCPLSFSAKSLFLERYALADIIHYHFPWPFADYLHFCSPRNKPTLLTYHSDIIKQSTLLNFYRPLEKRFLDSVDSIVATSQTYADSSSVLSQYSGKTSIIPIGLSESSLPGPSDQMLSYWSQKVGSNFVLFVGGLRYYKGLRCLIDAAGKLGDDYQIVIAGDGGDGGALRGYAVSRGINNVNFLGSVSDEDKAALMVLSGLVVLPSHLRTEAFGVVLLEGARFSKPLVCSDIESGMKEINIDGETGLVFSACSSDDLSSALLKLLSDSDLRRRLGNGARKHYLAHYNGTTMGAKYQHLYEALFESQR